MWTDNSERRHLRIERSDPLLFAVHECISANIQLCTEHNSLKRIKLLSSLFLILIV